MPATAFALALAAAFLHAGWNVLLGGARDVRAATTAALVLAVVLFAPVAAATWSVDASAMPWIVASSALELVYFGLLTTAYARSDVSLVYPVARGTAPVLVLVVSVLVGATVGTWQALGVLFVALGVVLVRGLRGPADRRGLLLALALGGTIAAYTLVDNEGIEHAAAVPYLVLVLAPVALVALVLELGTGRSTALRSVSLPTAVGAAAASFGAYALVLAALELSPAAPVAAVRESSILFATVLGWLFLREHVAPGRLAGAALIVGGVALVAVS